MTRTSLLFASAMLLFGACTPASTVATGTSPAGASQGAEATLAGTVTYRQRIALPPDAVAEVRLEDDAGGVIAQTTVPAAGRQVPLPFALRYDRSRIVAGADYRLHARIREAGGRVLFETSPPLPVLERSAAEGPVEVVLVAGTSAETALPTGVSFRLIGLVRGGQGVALPGGEALTITFGTDASYTGQAGCKGFGGTYGAATGVATLGAPISTMQMCPEPSASQPYLTALAGAHAEAIRDATLTFVSPAGDRLTFERGE